MSDEASPRLTDEWKVWVWRNFSEGCSKDVLFKVLVDSGFAPETARHELGHQPSVPLDRIRNPLTDPPPALDSVAALVGHLAAHGAFYVPGAVRLDSDLAEVYTVEGVLDGEECARMVEIIRGNLRPSTVTSADPRYAGDRTSRTADLMQLRDPLIFDVDRRLANLLGIHPSYAEGVEGQYYGPGEQFKAHSDAFHPEVTDDLEAVLGERGQRTWTAMVYLNDTETGGETDFPQLATRFRPRAGRAVVWNNLLRDGTPNPATVHAGMPVEKGFKAILTKWFRQRGDGAMMRKTPGEYLPAYTATGIERRRIPDALFRRVLEFYRARRAEAVTEAGDGYLSERASEMIELPAELKAALHAELQGVLETWTGAALEPTAVYGIRRYRRDARLRMHRDTVETHVASAILMVDQQVERPWPLAIFDHAYRRHEIALEPGEMVLYEGARLAHGRPDPLEGDFFCNLYVHYRPRDLMERLRALHGRSLPAETGPASG